MAVPVGIATLGLTYSADPGPEDIYRGPSTGSVATANMNSFDSTLGRFGDRGRDDSFAAHILGDIGSSFNFPILPEEPLTTSLGPLIQWDIGMQQIIGNHFVSSSGVCKTPAWKYNITDSVVVLKVEGSNDTVVFPAIAFGSELIYYLTTPITYDRTGSNGSCGAGWSNIKVLEPARGPPAPGSLFSNPGIFFYDCNITVISTTPDNTFPARNGAKAAQAIALSGQIHPEFLHFGHGFNNYVAYTFDVAFGEPQNNSAPAMASLLSRFAIGVIAAAAQTNPALIVRGAEPMQGVRLTLSYPLYSYLILGLIAGTQLLLVMLTAFFLRDMEIPEEILLSHEEEIRKRFVLR